MAVGGPIENLAFDSGDNYNVFLNLTFPVAGRITSWGFYAKKTGTVWVDVWRPLGNWNYTLIAKTLLTANSIGKQVGNAVV